MSIILNFANGLWESGHFYQAVLVFMPVQIACVLYHNITLWMAAIIVRVQIEQPKTTDVREK
jgi:hypothetical protein